jgi:dolichyl-diphosphooligosaccharide--protein glycosyltransferase
MLENSLIYKLYYHGVKPGVHASEDKFKEVFRGHYGKVRIFMIRSSKESKEWVEQNRECDAGGWFCPGKYPPALQDILNKKKDFAQLEDFNRKTSDKEYQKEYFENLNNPELAKKKAELLRQKEAKPEERVRPNNVGQTKPNAEAKPKTTIQEKLYNTWEDNKDTARMSNLIRNNEIKKLERWLRNKPENAWIRSADGRGPMWWAFESKNQDAVAILNELGVPNSDHDKNGITPKDLLKF